MTSKKSHGFVRIENDGSATNPYYIARLYVWETESRAVMVLRTLPYEKTRVAALAALRILMEEKLPTLRNTTKALEEMIAVYDLDPPEGGV